MKARLGGPDSVYLPAQQQLVDLMRAQSVSAGEAVVRILEEGNVPAILRFGVESDRVTLLQNPTTSIACDCGATTSTLGDGHVTGEQRGRVLARTTHMPSRPMSTDVARRVSGRGVVMNLLTGQGASAAQVQIEFDVRQRASAGKAEGSFRLSVPISKTTIQSRDIGLLQASDRWATFTGKRAAIECAAADFER